MRLNVLNRLTVLFAGEPRIGRFIIGVILKSFMGSTVIMNGLMLKSYCHRMKLSSFQTFCYALLKTIFCVLHANKWKFLFSHAIERVRTQYPEGSYDGQLWHFRWGRDCRIYHWRDFEDFYGENSSYEWYHAEELRVSDEEFIIPEFLLHAVAKDLSANRVGNILFFVAL